MLGLDFQRTTIREFPGADLLEDEADLPGGGERPPGAVLSKNVEFGPGQVSVRRGIAEFFDPNLAIQSMFNWLQSSWNILVMFAINSGAPKVLQRRLHLGTGSDVVTGLSASAVDCSFESYGSRLIMAFLNSVGLGVDQGRIWNGLFDGGGPIVDKLFQAPLAETTDFTVGIIDTSSGVVNAGTHYVGMILRTRNGYDTKAVVFNTPFVAAGGAQMQVTITPVGNWPDWVDTFDIIMTTATNPDQFWIVPESRTALSPGTGLAGAAIVNLSDEALVGVEGGPLDATEYFNLISQASGGTGPWSPKFIGRYEGRTTYITDILDEDSLGSTSVAYFSEPGKPQWITADLHAVTLPSKLPMTCGFQLGNLYFILGPSWTYAFSDNGDKPASWAGGQEISSQIGTSSVHGVDVNNNAGVAWVFHRSGLYPFQGTRYPILPISYRQKSDWDRINWAAQPGVFQVRDDPSNQRVGLQVPLDGSNVATHIMWWNYRRGIDPYSADYTLDSFAGPESIGSFIIGHHYPRNIREMWVGPGSADSIFRQKSVLAGDSNLYNDNSAGIDSQWTSQALPGAAPAPLQHAGAFMRLRGAGTARVTFYDRDLQNAIGPRSIAGLSLTPGRDQQQQIRLQSDAAHVKIDNNATADAYFILSRIIWCWKPWVLQR